MLVFDLGRFRRNYALNCEFLYFVMGEPFLLISSPWLGSIRMHLGQTRKGVCERYAGD